MHLQAHVRPVLDENQRDPRHLGTALCLAASSRGAGAAPCCCLSACAAPSCPRNPAASPDPAAFPRLAGSSGTITLRCKDLKVLQLEIPGMEECLNIASSIEVSPGQPASRAGAAPGCKGLAGEGGCLQCLLWVRH